MLLQISEPGVAADPSLSVKRRAVGIDLGTTHSLVATVRDSEVEVLADAEGATLLPSIVHYAADGVVRVGASAQAQQALDARNTIVSVKRLMGRARSDVGHLKNLPYDFEGDGASNQLRLRTISGVQTPVEVSAQILKVLNARAQAALGGDIEGAVITVPAYFDDAQRQATRDAARLAGLPVLRLLSEPTAAALAYGLERARSGTFVIFDLGGGTFDVSVLRLTEGVFEVLAIGGDSSLGGDDFDHRLYCWILEQANLSLLSPQDQRTLTERARAAKHTLSTKPNALIQARLENHQWVNLSISAEIFAGLTQSLVAKTINASKRALHDAGLATKDIDGVVLVGGATRMPSVVRAVTDFFGRAPLTDLDPERVVAIGAAMQADLLIGNRQAGEPWLLLDVVPLSLGLETMGGLVERIIARNARIPISATQEFTTFKDGQRAMALHVVQGERDLVADCRSLARFELRGIPPMVAGAARIRVNFEVDADGLLAVAAQEVTTGVQASITVKPSYGLSDEQVTQMLRAAMQGADDDAQQRRARERSVDAQRLLEATRSALAIDADLLPAQERAHIEALMDELTRLTQQVPLEPQALSAATQALTQATEAFAAQRMDRSVRLALAGRRVDDILAP